MTDSEHTAPTSDWSWLESDDLVVGFLMFVRGASPQQILTGFGIDPSAGRLLPADRADEALSAPVYDYNNDYNNEAIHPWLRSGTAGDWSFAIDQSGIDVYEYEETAQQLSSNTSLAIAAWTPNIDNFYYWENGTQVTSFEPGMWWDRHGVSPDRFLPQMLHLGLQTEPPTPVVPRNDTDRWPFPLIPTLEILTLAFGIRLSADVVNGPLLTAQRA
jgi:hypothetical protein